MEVGTLWVIYIVALIVITLIFWAIQDRTKGMLVSLSFFAAAIIAGIIILILAPIMIDKNGLTESEQNWLNLLWITIFVVPIFALIWFAFDVNSNKGKAAHGCTTVTTETCDLKTGVCEPVKKKTICTDYERKPVHE